MDVGNPSDDDKSQVQLNQLASSSQTPTKPPPAPVADDSSTMPAPVTTSPPPATAVPTKEAVPNSGTNIGIGSPNIGVEKKLEPSPKVVSDSMGTSERIVPPLAPDPTPVVPPVPAEAPAAEPPAEPRNVPVDVPIAPPTPPAPSNDQIQVSDTNPPVPQVTPNRDENSSVPPESTISVTESNINIPSPGTKVEHLVMPESAQSQDTINVATNVPVNTYDQAKTTDLAANQTSPQPSAPIPANSPAVRIGILAALALVVGLGGGFFGFKYWDSLKTTAQTNATNNPSTNLIDSSTYSSEVYKFTVDIPEGWENVISNPDDLIFASDSASLSATPTGNKIEITFLDPKDKTLKTWVEANATTTNEKQPIKEITVSGEIAYQQALKNNGGGVSTFIERPGKIMIVTYTAAPEKLGEGGSIYNAFINSIRLN